MGFFNRYKNEMEYCIYTIFKTFILQITFLFVCTPNLALAERVISSFPLYENFDQDNYSDIHKFTAGATHEWRSDEGWSGGAARFTPPTTEGYSGIGNFSFQQNDTRQLNVRLLIKHGRTFHYHTGTNKLIITNRKTLPNNENAPGLVRPMVITAPRNSEASDGNLWKSFRPCHGTVCWPLVDTGTEELKMGSSVGTRYNEWISVELETNLDLQVINLYIHTQDGEITGLFQVNPFVDEGSGDTGEGVFAYIDVIGGYFNQDVGLGNDSDNYFIIDELVISDSYIGPPTDFLKIPKNPTGLSTD